MSRAKPPPSAEELFLAPVASLARKAPEIEALVFWGGMRAGRPSHPRLWKAKRWYFTPKA